MALGSTQTVYPPTSSLILYQSSLANGPVAAHATPKTHPLVGALINVVVEVKARALAADVGTPFALEALQLGVLLLHMEKHAFNVHIINV